MKTNLVKTQNYKLFKYNLLKLQIYSIQPSFDIQIAALIRSCKVPEPYKGKGILYATEKITLKEGKKV